MENGFRTVKEKHKLAHMKAAFAYAACSTAVRLQVGCVIVKDNRVISIGYNGMPSGWTNECEDEVFSKVSKIEVTKELVTKPEVLHAEMNALMKLARSTESGEGASAFITHQPCMECSKGLYQAGIKEIFYVHPYRLDDGLKFLKECKIPVEQIDV